MTKRNSETIARAASLQAQQLRINSPLEEASKIANIYNISEKAVTWREFGDISLHLIVKYPPDLAYLTLYAFRELQIPLGYDPVPFILKAIEMTAYLKTKVICISSKEIDHSDHLMNNATDRARKSAKILSREISVTPLRFASSILWNMDRKMKQLISEELKNFNPDAAAILSKSSAQRLFTKLGIVKFISRLLFGKE